MTPPGALLTVMAHPDDAELWAGGTIARHVSHGGTATIAVARHGPVRMAEAEAGARILGAHLHVLNSADATTIGTLRAELQPDVLITHPPSDIHPEHRHCADAVLGAVPDAVIATGHPRRLYHCDGYYSLDQHGVPLYLSTIIDVTPHWETKIAALRSHQSQPIDDHFAPMAETLAHLHGHRIGTTYAEAFRALPVLGRLPATAGL